MSQNEGMFGLRSYQGSFEMSPAFRDGVRGAATDNHILVSVLGGPVTFRIRWLCTGGSISKGRLEAFSDGVIAIIITIMVLEMKVPHGDRVEELMPLIPTFLSYVLSYVYVGIYWNNHHHLLHTSTAVTGAMLWANLHLLFWLSLLPFATGWMGETILTRHPPFYTALCC